MTGSKYGPTGRACRCQPQAISSRCILAVRRWAISAAAARRPGGRARGRRGVDAALAAGAPEELGEAEADRGGDAVGRAGGDGDRVGEARRPGLRISGEFVVGPQGVDLGEVGEIEGALSRQGSRSPPPASTSPGSRRSAPGRSCRRRHRLRAA